MSVSSLPSGWHGAIGPCKTSTSTSVGLSGSSVSVTIRKKWNSPQATNVPQTRLPSYKSSNLRQQQNAHLNGTYLIKSSETTSSTSQTKLLTSTKPSPVKEYRNEIEKLKKEVTTIKAENSILKAKVRRVDDENVQKGRQIEKLRAEIKALQKSQVASATRKKESQELLSLRQKCLRLENALKEKDLVIKKLTSESSVIRGDADNSKISTSNVKQIYQVTCATQNKNSSKNSGKESLSAKSSLSRASLSLKTEVSKLRDMIHKLEKENQELQQDAKLHCQEIRRLKVQLKSKDKSMQSQVSASKTNLENVKNARNKSVLTSSNREEIPRTNVNSQTFSVPKQKLERSKKPPVQASAQMIPKQPVSQKSIVQRSSSKVSQVSSLPNGSIKKISNNKQIRCPQSKLPVTKSALTNAAPKTKVKPSNSNTLVPTNHTKDVELENKIQEMRENIAAKKIQRGWRQHKNELQDSVSHKFQNDGKALTFIISSLKHHKSRKAKINLLVKKKDASRNSVKKDVFMEAIESVAKKVWDQECSS